MSAARTSALLRRLLLLLLALGLVATAVDLVLISHFEDGWQQAPLALLGAGAVVTVWYAAAPTRAAVRLFQATMMLFVLAAVTGTVLHYRGNLEFQLDIDASQRGWDLFWKVVRAKAPPAMAPLAMAQLGLLGLITTYRHPAVTPPATGQD